MSDSTKPVTASQGLGAQPPAELGKGKGLVQAVVAPRRTVHDGQAHRGPGAVVLLPRATVTFLREAGFLMPAEAAPAAPVSGPNLNGNPGDVIQPQ